MHLFCSAKRRQVKSCIGCSTASAGCSSRIRCDARTMQFGVADSLPKPSPTTKRQGSEAPSTLPKEAARIFRQPAPPPITTQPVQSAAVAVQHATAAMPAVAAVVESTGLVGGAAAMVTTAAETTATAPLRLAPQLQQPQQPLLPAWQWHLHPQPQEEAGWVRHAVRATHQSHKRHSAS